MAEQTSEQAAESAAADFIFGPEEAQQQPVPEGAEEDAVEAEEVELSEEEEEAAEQLAEDLPEMFEVAIGENVYEVPAEIKDELEKAKDYTQKTQGLSKQWKEAETKMGELQAQAQQFAFMESVQEEINQAQVLDWQIQQYRQYQRDNVDNLGYQELEKIRIKIAEMEEAKNAISSSVQQKYTDHQQALEQSTSELKNKSTEVLKQTIPNWDDDTDKALRDYAVSSGYTEQEYDNLVDPRLKGTLWKAQQFDKLKEGSAAAVQKVQTAPKIQPKARNPMPKDVQNKLNLRKKLKSSRSASDKANLIGESIADRFGM